MCHILKASESGYYYSLLRACKPRHWQLLLIKIRQIFAQHPNNNNYGVEAFEYEKQEKTQLDEQELEQIELIISESLYYYLPVKVTYWKDDFNYDCEGIVSRVNH